MSKTLSDAAVLAIAAAAAWFVTPWARMGWVLVALPEYVSTRILWLDYGYLTLWIFEFLWGAVFGALLTRMLRSHALLWSAIFGLGLGVLHFLGSNRHVNPDAPFATYTYVWAYGEYLVPLFAAVLGSLGVGKWWPRRQKVVEHAA